MLFITNYHHHHHYHQQSSSPCIIIIIIFVITIIIIIIIILFNIIFLCVNIINHHYHDKYLFNYNYCYNHDYVVYLHYGQGKVILNKLEWISMKVLYQINSHIYLYTLTYSRLFTTTIATSSSSSSVFGDRGNRIIVAIYVVVSQ